MSARYETELNQRDHERVEAGIWEACNIASVDSQEWFQIKPGGVEVRPGIWRHDVVKIEGAVQ